MFNFILNKKLICFFKLYYIFIIFSDVEKIENKPESTVSNLSCKNSASVSDKKGKSQKIDF